MTSIKRTAARRSAREEFAFKREMTQARIDAGLNQSQLADRLGVHRSTISRIERLDSDPRLSDIRTYLAHCSAALSISVVTTCDLMQADVSHGHEAAINNVRRARIPMRAGKLHNDGEEDFVETGKTSPNWHYATARQR
ncbi:helix-turn-helix domain-containing protein [Tsukamurella sp. NPDC003166]|uniref:helix-turn-helix transcriptional regulator n=1 Tax=Tsukamurella sp. NPDC003166 TaxID=3154444 RepID=UPI0033B21AD1